MGTLLERELHTYEEKKEELLGKAQDKFALIKDDQVVDIFETESDAINQGYVRFGNVPFLVKQIVDVEVPLNFTSNMLDL